MPTGSQLRQICWFGGKRPKLEFDGCNLEQVEKDFSGLELTPDRQELH